MKLRAPLAVCAVFFSVFLNSPANAITYTLSNVPLTDGGVLNGDFIVNVYGGFSGYSLTTSGGALPAEVYTYSPTYPPPSATAGPVFGTPLVLDFFPNANPGTNYVLQLSFSSNLLNGNASLLGGPFSFECILSYNCESNPSSGLTRYVAAETLGGGNLTATPLPATFLLFGTALLGGGILIHRRRQLI